MSAVEQKLLRNELILLNHEEGWGWIDLQMEGELASTLELLELDGSFKLQTAKEPAVDEDEPTSIVSVEEWNSNLEVASALQSPDPSILAVRMARETSKETGKPLRSAS
jgi:hypothetical protein